MTSGCSKACLEVFGTRPNVLLLTWDCIKAQYIRRSGRFTRRHSLVSQSVVFQTRSQNFIECFIAKFFSTLVSFLPVPTSQLLHWNMIQMAVQSDPIPAAAGAVQCTKLQRARGARLAKVLQRFCHVTRDVIIGAWHSEDNGGICFC